MPTRSTRRRKPEHSSIIKGLKLGVGRLAMATGAVALIAGGVMAYKITIHQPEQYHDLLTDKVQVMLPKYDNFNCSTLEEILSHQDASVTPQQRRAALRDNTSMVLEMRENYSLVPVGSATMISTGGYFTTVAHNIDDALNNPKIKGILIFHLSTNSFYLATSAILDIENAAAILYAPTGYPHSPVKGIEFRSDEVNQGEKLNLTAIGFTSAYPPKYRIASSSGKLTDSSVLEKPFIIEGKEIYFGANPGALIVEGIRPSGGTSGGSVSDDKGKIVGTEEGAYGGIDVKDYKGATVTPVSFLKPLAKQCSVQILGSYIKP